MKLFQGLQVDCISQDARMVIILFDIIYLTTVLMITYYIHCNHNACLMVNNSNNK